MSRLDGSEVPARPPAAPKALAAPPNRGFGRRCITPNKTLVDACLLCKNPKFVTVFATGPAPGDSERFPTSKLGNGWVPCLRLRRVPKREQMAFGGPSACLARRVEHVYASVDMAPEDRADLTETSVQGREPVAAYSPLWYPVNVI